MLQLWMDWFISVISFWNCTVSVPKEREGEGEFIVVIGFVSPIVFVDCFQSNTLTANFEAPHVSLFALHERLVSCSHDECQHYSCYLQTRCLSLPLVVVFIDSLLASVHGASPLPCRRRRNQSDEGMIFERSSKAINRYGVRQDLGPCKFATRLARCSAGTSSLMRPRI